MAAKKEIKAKAKPRPKRTKTERFDFCSGILELDGKPAKFTVKERKFVNAYLTDAKFEATKAAELAEYEATSQNSLRVIACQLMKRHRVREAINAAIEALTMPKFEVLFRLATQAGGSINDTIGESGNLDLIKARENGSVDNIHSIEITERILEVKTEAIDKPKQLNLPEHERDPAENIEKSLIERKTKWKMYSSQNALKILTDVNFAKKHELTGKDGKDLPATAPATVTIFLPDNGRNDSPAALAEKAKTQAKAKNIGKDKPKQKKKA